MVPSEFLSRRIEVKITRSQILKALKDGECDLDVKRGRPTKEEIAARAAAEAGDDEESEEDDGEEEAEEEKAPAKKAKKAAPAKKPAKKKAAEEDEDDGEEEADDEESEDEEADEDDGEETEAEDDEFATGADLKKIKAALTAHSAKGDKNKTVKILKKFGPTSEKVPVGKVAALLKALKA